MKEQMMTDIPMIGDETCQKSLYEILKEVQDDMDTQGCTVSEVRYGYSVEYQMNALMLTVVFKEEVAGKLIYLVLPKGERLPSVQIHNQAKKVLTNWGIQFYFMGLFPTSTKQIPEKQEKLQKAVEAFRGSAQGKYDFEKLFSTVISSIRPGDGLVWSQVEDAIEEALEKPQVGLYELIKQEFGIELPDDQFECICENVQYTLVHTGVSLRKVVQLAKSYHDQNKWCEDDIPACFANALHNEGLL